MVSKRSTIKFLKTTTCDLKKDRLNFSLGQGGRAHDYGECLHLTLTSSSGVHSGPWLSALCYRFRLLSFGLKIFNQRQDINIANRFCVNTEN
jgi:hypothetical protein